MEGVAPIGAASSRCGAAAVTAGSSFAGGQTGGGECRSPGTCGGRAGGEPAASEAGWEVGGRVSRREGSGLASVRGGGAVPCCRMTIPTTTIATSTSSTVMREITGRRNGQERAGGIPVYCTTRVLLGQNLWETFGFGFPRSRVLLRPAMASAVLRTGRTMGALRWSVPGGERARPDVIGFTSGRKARSRRTSVGPV